jgi:hypothetical protein
MMMNWHRMMMMNWQRIGHCSSAMRGAHLPGRGRRSHRSTRTGCPISRMEAYTRFWPGTESLRRPLRCPDLWGGQTGWQTRRDTSREDGSADEILGRRPDLDKAPPMTGRRTGTARPVSANQLADAVRHMEQWQDETLASEFERDYPRKTPWNGRSVGFWRCSAKTPLCDEGDCPP